MKSPFFELAKGMLFVSAIIFTGTGLYLTLCVVNTLWPDILLAPIFSLTGISTIIMLIFAQVTGTKWLLQTSLFKKRREEWRQFAIRYKC